MKGAILYKGEACYTYMKPIFDAIQVQKNYNWLITSIEDSYPRTPEICEYYNFAFGEYTWITGDELTELIEKDNFQWVWAVLSGFQKNIPKEQVLRYPFPHADGNKRFWENPVSIQHPLADIEIVPFDSSLVLVISKCDKIVNDFVTAFPLAEDLESYNSRIN